MNLDNIVNEVIPPSDYEHRNGFSNIPIIDKLAKNEKELLEEALIQKLHSEAEKQVDPLIVDTLAYLKSRASLPVLKNLLESHNYSLTRLKIASAIFEISHDDTMIDIAVSLVKEMDNKKDAYYVSKLTTAFYYLAKFKVEIAKQVLEEYSSHPDYLISYNAKRASEM